MSHHLFPLGDTANWSATAYAKESVTSWLFDPQSLTAKLKQISDDFKVEVLGQAWFKKSTQQVQLKYSQPCLIREVLLYNQGKPWVYAHTQVPFATINRNPFLVKLGNSSLGEAIFTQPELSRGKIEVAQFLPNHPIYLFDQSLKQPSLNNVKRPSLERLFGRCSEFSLNESSLSVTEIFLSNCPFYYE